MENRNKFGIRNFGSDNSSAAARNSGFNSSMSRGQFLRTAGIGAGAVAAAGLGLSGTVNAYSPPQTVVVHAEDGLAQIRNKIAAAGDGGTVLFEYGTYDLSEPVFNGAVLDITKSVTLKALDPTHKPVILVRNTAFDPNAWNFEAHAIRVKIPEGTTNRTVVFDSLQINQPDPAYDDFLRGLDVVACDNCTIRNCDLYTGIHYFQTVVEWGNFPAAPFGCIVVGTDASIPPSADNKITGTVKIQNCNVKGMAGINFNSIWCKENPYLCSPEQCYGIYGSDLDPNLCPCNPDYQNQCTLVNYTNITANILVENCVIETLLSRGIGCFEWGGSSCGRWNNGKYTVRFNTIIGATNALWNGLAGTINFSNNDLTNSQPMYGFFVAIECYANNPNTFSAVFNQNKIHMMGESISEYVPVIPIVLADANKGEPANNMTFTNNIIDGTCPVHIMVMAYNAQNNTFQNFNRKNMKVAEVQHMLEWFFGIPYTNSLEYALISNPDYEIYSINNTIIDNAYENEAVPYARIFDITSICLPGMQGYPYCPYNGQNTLLGRLRNVYGVAGKP